MKKFLVVVSSACMTAALLAQGSVEQTLMDLERQWSKASVAGDRKVVDALLAPDFVVIREDGSLQTRAEYLAAFQKMESADTTDMKVQVHGNAAVVTGIASGMGRDSAGRPFEFKVRYAETFVKMPDGKWRCIMSAGVPMK